MPIVHLTQEQVETIQSYIKDICADLANELGYLAAAETIKNIYDNKLNAKNIKKGNYSFDIRDSLLALKSLCHNPSDYKELSILGRLTSDQKEQIKNLSRSELTKRYRALLDRTPSQPNYKLMLFYLLLILTGGMMLMIFFRLQRSEKVSLTPKKLTFFNSIPEERVQQIASNALKYSKAKVMPSNHIPGGKYTVEQDGSFSLRSYIEEESLKIVMERQRMMDQQIDAMRARYLKASEVISREVLAKFGPPIMVAAKEHVAIVDKALNFVTFLKDNAVIAEETFANGGGRCAELLSVAIIKILQEAILVDGACININRVGILFHGHNDHEIALVSTFPIANFNQLADIPSHQRDKIYLVDPWEETLERLDRVLINPTNYPLYVGPHVVSMRPNSLFSVGCPKKSELEMLDSRYGSQLTRFVTEQTTAILRDFTCLNPAEENDVDVATFFHCGK